MMKLIAKNRFYFTKCMILHPVCYPNKGANTEQYLAQEAVGLVKSLGWDVVSGPFWKENSKIIVPHRVGHSRLAKNQVFIQSEQTNEIRDGDYIRTSIGNGIIDKGGIWFDPEDDESEGDMMKEWKDKILRSSLANSSLVKCRQVTKRTFFTRGRLHAISKDLYNKDVECIFVNESLQPVQIKNLKKYFEARLNDVNVGVYKAFGDSQADTEFVTEGEDLQPRRRNQNYRKILIFDRFSIILQIFAQRTASKLSKLQTELLYLSYMKTRLTREGSTYITNLNLFYGNLITAEQVTRQVKSAKQKKVVGGMGGQGQSQMDLERRRIRDRLAKIKRQIQEERRLRDARQQKLFKRNKQIPVIALVGYTNVGKSAFLNHFMKKQEVTSKDMLFQTLHTTNRHINLQSGRKMCLLDTIGFITNLPVQMVDAFKSTLEQISQADVVLHLRDISHPQSELQKKSVLNILEDLKFDSSFYNQRMIQVWNKVDLISKQQRQQVQRIEQQEKGKPQIKISCTTGQGMKELMEAIDMKLKDILKMNQFQIQYGIQYHKYVLEWLKQNSNVGYLVQPIFQYEASKKYPSGKVIMNLDLDEMTRNKLERFLDPTSKKKKGKDMPPQNW